MSDLLIIIIGGLAGACVAIVLGTILLLIIDR
jgi:hypothetical protein